MKTAPARVRTQATPGLTQVTTGRRRALPAPQLLSFYSLQRLLHKALDGIFVHSLCRTRYDPPADHPVRNPAPRGHLPRGLLAWSPAALGERLLWPRKPGCFIVHQAVATALLSPRPLPPLVGDAAPFRRPAEATRRKPTSRHADRHPRAGACAMGALVPHWVKSASDKLRALKLVTAEVGSWRLPARHFVKRGCKGQRCIDCPYGRFTPTTYSSKADCPATLLPRWTANRWVLRACGRVGGERMAKSSSATPCGSGERQQPRAAQPLPATGRKPKNMPAHPEQAPYDAWLTPARKRPRFCASTRPVPRPAGREQGADKVPKKDWLG